MQEKREIDIAFVILQYGAYSATRRCIESIYRNVKDNFEIIVVDNYSPDDSLSRLEKEYAQRENIIIIKSEKNLGFSGGNNLGFLYAKENLSAKFIVLLNNDTELLSDSFVDEIKAEYDLSKFAVMGPMILSGDGRYTSNPSRSKTWTEAEIRKCIQMESIFLWLEKMNLGLFYDLYMGYKQHFKKKKTKDPMVCLNKQENIELHGSFWIFSRKYINLFDGLDARTFMYCEEPLLTLSLKKHALKSVYNPNIIVYHAEDASTDSTYKRGKKKKVFYLTTHIESCKALLKAVQEYSGIPGGVQ